MTTDDMRFPAGATAVRRHVWKGKVWTATPYRVLDDTGPYFVAAAWPGLRCLFSTSWIDCVTNGGPRDRTLAELASGAWELGWWTWQRTTVRSWYAIDSYFTVRQQFDADHRPLAWYVDFDLPKQRTRLGIDTFDLMLDLVVEPDLSRHRWKDEDEYRHGRRLGLIGDHVHREVDRARQEILGLIETRQGPFAHDWSPLAHATWPAPALPANVRDL